MDSLAWILVGGMLMSGIAMVGSVTVLLPPATLERLLLPLVAIAAGTLLGGAFFHMLPEGIAAVGLQASGFWIAGGFTVFLAMEQFLRWHHSHHASKASQAPAPVTYLVLIGDALHNFLGGLAIGSTFLLDPTAGVIAWVAAAAHEVPQELGDFGVLVHGGWPRRKALWWNFLSAITFPLGGVVAWGVARQFAVGGLVLFGAGNFIYIAASDLIPEIKTSSGPRESATHFLLFLAGLGLLAAVATVLGHTPES